MMKPFCRCMFRNKNKKKQSSSDYCHRNGVGILYYSYKEFRTDDVGRCRCYCPFSFFIVSTKEYFRNMVEKFVAMKYRTFCKFVMRTEPVGFPISVDNRQNWCYITNFYLVVLNCFQRVAFKL